MKFVTRNFPRVVLMQHGRVLLDGSREEVLTPGMDVLKQAYVTPPPITRVAIFGRSAWMARSSPFRLCRCSPAGQSGGRNLSLTRQEQKE
ncbi:hypothetical protein [Bifidobacterium sp. ESL0825]|uniref:hypothetical protein n=1 Tax=Bifidobacterium sp. ESL0825 TaxID=3448587 RepID=UPI004040FCD7